MHKGSSQCYYRRTALFPSFPYSEFTFCKADGQWYYILGCKSYRRCLGYDWTGAETMYGPMELVCSVLRGASQAYGHPIAGAHHAVQWSTTPHDIEPRYRRYRLALYILIDHPEKTVIQCIRESKEMMRGHKAELFRLDLSMIGWLLLDMFVPFAAVWTAPYTNTVWAMYYEALSNRNAQEAWSFNPDL